MILEMSLEKGWFATRNTDGSRVLLVDRDNPNRYETDISAYDLAKMGRDRIKNFYVHLRLTLNKFEAMKERKAVHEGVNKEISQ